MFVVIYLRRPDSALKLATAEYFQHDLHGLCCVWDGSLKENCTIERYKRLSRMLWCACRVVVRNYSIRHVTTHRACTLLALLSRMSRSVVLLTSLKPPPTPIAVSNESCSVQAANHYLCILCLLDRASS